LTLIASTGFFFGHIKHTHTNVLERDSVVYWKTKRKIKDDLQ